jgi:Zn-dependent protease
LFTGITQWFNDLTTNPSATLITLAYTAVAILFSLILHECAHGWVAYKCGDPTAKMLGRLTLNPLKHLDPIGTICMLFLHVGWAKPVPINPRNFRRFRRDYILVSLAGIITNLLLFLLSLIISALLCKFMYDPELLEYAREKGLQNNLLDIYHMIFPNAVYGGVFDIVSPNVRAGCEWMLYVQRLFLMLAQMNLGLAIFNLIPVPPLDGYRFLDMFVFKGRLAMERSTMNIIQIAFLVICMSGLLSNFLGTVNGAVFGFFSNFIAHII